MGASNGSVTIKVDTNKGETFRAKWNDFIEEETYQYGHDPYNGTLTTCSGVSTRSMPSDIDETDKNTVLKYIWDNTEKWGNAMAIKFKDEDGIETWLCGGWCAS